MTSTLIAARQLNEEQPATSPADEIPLHIASIVVHASPEHLSGLKAWLLEQTGIEIHAESAQGKLVVVIETLNEQNILDLIDEVIKRPGALNAALVYHEMISGQELAFEQKMGTEEHNLL